MGTSKNIIVGAAQVFLGPSLSEATGADIDARVTAWTPTLSTPATNTNRYGPIVAGTTGWRDVGYTQDGVEIATDPSWGEVEVDQLLDAAKIFKDGMGMSVSTTFAEATLENLLVAWGQRDSYLTETANVIEAPLEGGALGEAPLERGLIAVGNAPEKANSNAYGERTYFAYRVLSVDASTHTMARAEATTIPVTFRALPADNGRYGSVRDRLNVV
jgi:hypothetical protein